jgi:non-ribosomal peptide synthetase component F
LDPSLPSERVNYILQDSRANLIIVDNRTADLASGLASDACTFLNIDEIDGRECANDLDLSISSGDLASVLYTSGSTGTPKGVPHSHRSQLHTVMVNTNEVRISSEDRLTLLHTIGFGSAQAHLFQSLLNGAALCLFDLRSEGVHRLAHWLKHEAITVYHSPPAVFRALGDALPEGERFSSLRLVRLSGAPVSRADFDLYKKRFSPEALLHIVMNSTEANVVCSLVTDASFSFPETGSPVGYPVQDKKILLLDADGREIPPGEVGEIAVRSRYLPPINWKHFARDHGPANPSGAEERLHLTGDLGRLMPDGSLIHLGRKDFQVKIRGYRVEIAEIERALLEHPQVQDAGVAAWDGERDEKYLAAYVVPRGNSALELDELRNFLAKRVPAYMIPWAFMFLGSLPLTNGKLDRKALPKPQNKRAGLKQLYIAPCSDIEGTLVRIWEEVLDVTPIGIHDNFFDLGGHSLAASRVVSRVAKTYQLEIPIRLIFQFPTVAEMAVVITTSQAQSLGEQELESIFAELESLSDAEATRVTERAEDRK